MKHLLLCFSLLLPSILFCQSIQFKERPSPFGSNPPTSFIFNGVTDINGDLLDDVLSVDNGNHFIPYLQQNPYLPFLRDTSIMLGEKMHWTIAVGDLNGDGRRDIVLPGYTEPIKILYGHVNSFVYKDLDGQGIYPQALSLIDVNADGYLDIFLANDYARNVVFLNNGDETWTYEPTFFGESEQSSITAGNYGCTWTDFDLDGDLDLYVAKCYGDATDPKDPRRVNKLFEQVSPGHFVFDSLNRKGLAFGAQSWTSNFGDLDNDGDLDVLVTHHDSLAYLLRNDGGRYTRVERVAGVAISGFPLQSLLRDFDNNGYLDIMVAGNPAYLYLNQGNWSFARVPAPFGLYSPASVAVGDLNGDGFLDVYANYSFTNDFPQLDKIYINQGNSNSYISFNLVGDAPNTDAIGAFLTLYSKAGLQSRELIAGESYGISNSHLVHFGLGSVQKVDSVVIHWPDGTVNTFRDLRINTVNTLEKGGCHSVMKSLNYSSLELLCVGDTLRISAPTDAHAIVWMDGDTSRDKRVVQPGLYSAKWRNTQGCIEYSRPVTFVHSEVPTPRIEFLKGEEVNCEGTEVVLGMKSQLAGKWYGRIRTDTLRVLSNSKVYFTDTNRCGTFISEVQEVSFVTPPVPPLVQDVHVKRGDQAVLVSDREDTYWYNDKEDNTPVHFGSRWVLPGIMRDSTVWAGRVFEYKYGVGHYGLSLNQAKDLGYHVGRKNVSTYFTVQKDMILHSVRTKTDMPGRRTFEIFDPAGQMVFQKTIALDTGMNTILMDVPLSAAKGSYRISTNRDTNMQVLGTVSPRLVRSVVNFGYPYLGGGLFRIERSSLSPHAYYYFYDWEVMRMPLACSGDKVPVHIIVDTSLGVMSSHLDAQLNVFPNPTSEDELNIDIPDDFFVFPIHASFLSVEGKEILRCRIKHSQSNILDIHELSRGVYVLMLSDKSGQYYIQRIVKL